MTDDLLSHYQHELNYLRQLLQEYAQQHPKMAGRLRLGANSSDDPQINRLLESAAFLNAGLQHKLTDDFPEISAALLNNLAPHFLAPVPAMSIAQLQPNAQTLQNLKLIAKNTLLQLVAANDQQPCHFNTCYPVELWPIEITKAELTGLPLQSPVLVKKYPQLISALTHEIKSSLCLSLHVMSSALPWSELAPQKLTFYLSAEAPVNYHLYDLLQQTAFIVLAASRHDPEPILLERAALQWSGFAEDEYLLPYASQVKAPYRLLMDYAILPEKFLFFSVNKLQPVLQQKFKQAGQTLEIYFMLRQEQPALEKKITANCFSLGCTPVINLFAEQAMPIALQQFVEQYRITVNNLSADRQEVYAIQRVIAQQEEQAAFELLPFNSLQAGSQMPEAIFYESKRVPAWQAGRYDENSTEVLLSLVDKHYQRVELNGWQIKPEVYITNRNSVELLLRKNNACRLTFAQNGDTTVAKINYLRPFTPVRRPFLKKGAGWRYISHLSPHHLLLTGDETGLSAFKALLQLYNFDKQVFYQKQWDGLQKLTIKTFTARNPSRNPYAPFMQGIAVTLQADVQYFMDSSLFLLGNILERFLPLFTTSQFFTQLIIKTYDGGHYEWPMRLGEQPLL